MPPKKRQRLTRRKKTVASIGYKVGELYWGKKDRAFEIYLFKTLCGSIWKSEGRDAVLRYAIEAIDEIEGDEDDEFMDDEGVVEDPPLELQKLY